MANNIQDDNMGDAEIIGITGIIVGVIVAIGIAISPQAKILIIETKILRALKRNPDGLTTKEIQKILKYTETITLNYLIVLLNRGKISRKANVYSISGDIWKHIKYK